MSMPKLPSDAELRDRVVAGDALARAELAKRTRVLLYRLVVTRHGRRPSAWPDAARYALIVLFRQTDGWEW
jgi:hypothetical protein